MKTRSKYILLLFMGIIVLLLGGIFFTVQQEKEGPITAEASGPVYWQAGGVPSLSTTTCLLCGKSVDASNGTSVVWVETEGDGCVIEYYHWGPRGSRYCYSTITVHNTITHRADPTCIYDGYTYMECAQCGEQTTKTTLPALGHNYVSWGYNHDATCTEDGTETGFCGRCRKTTIRVKEGTALGHDPVTDPAVAATCTTAGLTEGSHCSRCDAVLEEQETAPALGHNYGSYVQTKAPTCTTAGTETATCTRCDATTSRTTSALGHSMSTSYVSATCTSGGYTYHYCTRSSCSYSYTSNQTSALGHNYTNYTSNNDATCTEDGTETGKCSRCSATNTRTDEGSALGHDLEHHDGQPATCTEIGWNDYETCSRCDYTTYREIAATGHTPGAAATCTTPQTCTECGAILVEALGHKTVSHLGQDPTCTAEGWKPYETCENCDYTTYEIIPALGHSFTNYVSDNNATCTEDGTETAKCDRCEVTDTRTDEGSALGHDWAEEWTTDGTAHWHECSRCEEINDKANHSGGTATCTEVAECEVCSVAYGEALGHDLQHHDAQAATCTEIGWDAYDTCSRCDYTTYEELPALGHTEAALVRENEVDATCTTAGSYDEVVYCSVCGEELSREKKTIEALGHSFTSYISNNDATCTEDGTETAKCDRCDVTDTRTDEGSALGHDWAEEWTTDGTAHWHECSRCDEINDKANHSGGEATCTNPAECEVCGAEYGEALGHDLEHHEAKPVTCTEIGWEAYETCTRCDYTTYVEIAAKGHTFGPDATCTEDQVCLECGEVISAATGHIPGSDATCTENQTCSVCGEILTPALGHSFTSYISDNNATCTEDGTETAKCDRCNVTDTRTDEGSALGHDWAEEWTTDGTSHWHECSRCDEINDKAPHSGGTSTCVTPAECEVCGAEYGEALGHTEGEPVRENEVEASCTEAGSYDEVVDCSVCGEELSREEKVIDALGHDIIEHEGQAATCTQNGWNAYETCNRAGCGYTTYREIAATGHTPGAAATCTTPQTCTVCGATLVEALGHSFVDGYCTTCGVSDEEALENDREDAKTDLDDVAQDVKDEIDASDLPDDVKEDLKDKLDEIINGAKDEVDGSTDFDDVNQAVEDAKEEIEDAVQNAEKNDTKSELDEIAQNAKEEIDASDLPDDVKEDLKDKIDEIIGGAKDEVDGSIDFDDVGQAVEDARQEIEDMILNAEKDDAKSDLDEIVQNAKEEIDASDLSDEEKNELKGKLDEVLSSAKEEIGFAATTEEIEEILTLVKEEIAALTENLTEGQPDASPLWPWLIAAIVISAVLSALFAWRHVKKVQGRGEAVGAKSVVTIAVATILIFVVVIGITLLIFAMV